ncbi:hypothetical protein ACFO3O_14575 [Dokdonia ponticola]|uniref:Uncharacterized protein n=1 Tax=Dokdonia ponticola TaxID=2041041 RepID=A0ABV9I1K7_9FLAO
MNLNLENTIIPRLYDETNVGMLLITYLIKAIKINYILPMGDFKNTLSRTCLAGRQEHKKDENPCLIL